ncbi:hypothetical protein CEXT_550211 [Caerostris extrusa]|uniref:Uncharacterized protein n=1 Tax=Caerostris extrusa TaxID=172846 RepID=A0AAV4XJQ2_CAEEX|nr:hypothetical protein CEXT_550211 [Caerostris extrusa]
MKRSRSRSCRVLVFSRVDDQLRDQSDELPVYILTGGPPWKTTLWQTTLWTLCTTTSAPTACYCPSSMSTRGSPRYGPSCT